MGLLDGVIGNMTGAGRSARRPGMGSTVAAGVVLALLVKAIRNHQAGQAAGEGRSFDPQGSQGGLGGLLGGGGLGGLLGGLGGAGALGALVGRLQQKGLGAQVDSWVGPGRNEAVEPDQLAQALDESDLADLEQQTGMPRQALLAELAKTLPDAVNEATPQGHLPDEAELQRIASPAPPRPM